MGSSFSEKLKDKKIAYGAALMGAGILSNYAMEELIDINGEIIGFFSGLLFGLGIAIILSVFSKRSDHI